MSNKPAVKPKPSQSDKSRCQFTTADNRQCRMLRFPGHKTLCALHAQQDMQLRGAESAGDSLLDPLDDFRTVATVNQSLGRLYSLLARNRIPVRNAATLAYISQLVLQTLQPLRDEIYNAQGNVGESQVIRSARRIHIDMSVRQNDKYEAMLDRQREAMESYLEEERNAHPVNEVKSTNEVECSNEDKPAGETAELQT